MHGPETQHNPVDPVAPHLLLYDGECGFCNGVVKAVLDRDRQSVFHFASLQSHVAAEQLARFGGRAVPAGDLDTVAAIVSYRQESPALLTKASAALFVLEVLGWPWKIARLLRCLPITWLDRMYDQIARNRHRLSHRRDRCVVPRPEQLSRFLDSARDNGEVKR